MTACARPTATIVEMRTRAAAISLCLFDCVGEEKTKKVKEEEVPGRLQGDGVEGWRGGRVGKGRETSQSRAPPIHPRSLASIVDKYGVVCNPVPGPATEGRGKRR